MRASSHGRRPSARWWALLVSLLQLLPLCFIIFLVLGLIILGIAQPTEAAAAGIIGTVLLSGFTRTMSWQVIYRACYGAAVTTAVILIILASAKLFSQLLAFTGATAGLVGLVADLEINRWIIFFLMMATVFIFCMFMDQLALMLIAVPVYSPMIAHLGFDPIWFWMLFLINITLGGITPPFGYTMFVFKSAAPDVSTDGDLSRRLADGRDRRRRDGAADAVPPDRHLATGGRSLMPGSADGGMGGRGTSSKRSSTVPLLPPGVRR